MIDFTSFYLLFLIILSFEIEELIFELVRGCMDLEAKLRFFVEVVEIFGVEVVICKEI